MKTGRRAIADQFKTGKKKTNPSLSSRQRTSRLHCLKRLWRQAVSAGPKETNSSTADSLTDTRRSSQGCAF